MVDVPRRVLGRGAARPDDPYGVPGQGRSLGISVASTAALFLLWFGVTAAGLIEPLFLPSPGAVLDRFFEVAAEGFGGATLLEHIWASLRRVLLAFVLATVTAVPIGILMGTSRWVRGVFDPPVEFYRPIPPLAYLPLMVIWFGIGELTKVVIIYLAVFAPMALNARAGAVSQTAGALIWIVPGSDIRLVGPSSRMPPGH